MFEISLFCPRRRRERDSISFPPTEFEFRIPLPDTRGKDRKERQDSISKQGREKEGDVNEKISPTLVSLPQSGEEGGK